MAQPQGRPRLRFWLIVLGMLSLLLLGTINLVAGHPWLALLNLVGILVLMYVVRDEASAKRRVEQPLRVPRPQQAASTTPERRRGRRKP